MKNNQMVLADKKLLTKENTNFRNYPQTRIDKIEKLTTEEKELTIRGETAIFDVKEWFFGNDPQQKKRRFVMPVEMLQYLPVSGLARDLAAVIMNEWFVQKPENGEIQTSLYRLAKSLGLSTCGRGYARLRDALMFLCVFKIMDQEVIEKICPKTGRVEDRKRITFGYIDDFSRRSTKNFKEIPLNQQELLIGINRYVIDALKTCIPCQIPQELLQEAAKIPPRNSKAIKNCIYYFTTLQVGKEITLKRSLETMKDVTEYIGKREAKLIPRINKCFDFLKPKVIIDYTWHKNREDKFIATITLAPIAKYDEKVNQLKLKEEKIKQKEKEKLKLID